MRKPDEPGQAAFAGCNLIYGLGMLAVLIWVPVPSWGDDWLLPVMWPVWALFMAINACGLYWSW